MNLSSTIKTAKSVITANSPILLVAAAVTGIVATGVLAAKGGYKARGIVDEAEEEKGEELTPKEKISLTWLCYAAPALTGVSAIASVVGVHTIHTKRNAALAGLYAIATNQLDDYTEKAEELLGTKKTQAVNDSVAQKAMDRAGPAQDHEVLILDDGSELCYDVLSGRYFMGSVPIIEKAVREIEHLIDGGGEASLNDFYEYLGLPSIPMGNDVGWGVADRIVVEMNSTLTSDGRAAISFSFRHPPQINYSRK